MINSIKVIFIAIIKIEIIIIIIRITPYLKIVINRNLFQKELTANRVLNSKFIIPFFIKNKKYSQLFQILKSSIFCPYL